MQDKVLWQFKYSIAYYLTSILLLLSDALGSAYQWSNIWKLLGAKIDGSNNITPNPWMMLLLCCVFYYSVAVGYISLLSFPEAWLRYQNALLSTQIPHYMPMVVSIASWNTSTALPRNDYIHVDIKMDYFSPKLPHWASFCPTYHIINRIISFLMKLKLINFSKISCAVINFAKWSYFYNSFTHFL